MLPYSREVLYSLFGELNTSFAILQLVAAILFASAFASLLLARSRLPLLLSGLLWIAAAGIWYFTIFAPLDFLAPVYGGIALAQGLILLITCALKPDIRPRKGLCTFFAGFTVLLFLLDLTAGPGWPSARVPGLHPAPLIFLNAALAVSLRRRVPGGALMALPLLIAAVSGYQAYVLDLLQSYLVPLGALLGAVALCLPRGQK